MPRIAGNVPDAPFGLQGDITPLSGAAAPEIHTHADPADFGAAIGQGAENLGSSAGNVAQQFMGLKLETQANQAELDFIKKSGDLTAKYSQYEGLQADAMRPQYNAELADLHDQTRATLPPFAQKMFDANTTRSLGVQTADYAKYAAGQVKQANIGSQEAMSGAAVNSASNLASVLDDNQVGQALGTIAHSGNAIADAKGLGFQASGVDSGTGNYSYPDTPEGKQAEAQHLQFTDGEKAKYFMTAAKTVADNQGASAAADWAQKHWDLMPDAAKVQMNQFLAPKIKNETISGNVANMNAGIELDYNKQIMANVPNSPTELAQQQQNPLDVIRKNEGVGYSKDSKGEVINGINSLAFPKEFAEARNILDTQGQGAATKYADDFFQKNILDKYDIKSLPPATQSIVADGLVNHGGGAFGQSLMDAAKGGASPQQLIDMRRQEYQRLATNDPQQYGASLKGWNARLDNLQSGGQSTQINKADYLRENGEQYVSNAVNAYLQKYPDDYYGSQIQERRARTEINHQMADEDKKLKADQDTVANAIAGSQTKGVPVDTYEELRQLPGMAPVLDKVMQQQPEFFDKIDKLIAAHNSKDQNEYGKDFYNLFKAIHAPTGDPAKITSAEQLYDHIGPNGGLTVAGLDRLQKDMAGKGTPEGEAEASQQKQTFKIVKNMLSGEDEGLGIKDPKGEEIYGHALPMLYKAIDDGKAKGIPVGELYDPASKNWVGNSVKGLKRPDSQWYSDMHGANGETGTLDTATPSGLQKALSIGQITRADAEAIALKNGWIRANPPAVPLAGAQ